MFTYYIELALWITAKKIILISLCTLLYCLLLSCARLVTAWKPDLILCTEQRDPQVSHWRKKSLVSFCKMVSGDRQVWQVTYSSVANAKTIVLEALLSLVLEDNCHRYVIIQLLDVICCTNWPVPNDQSISAKVFSCSLLYHTHVCNVGLYYRGLLVALRDCRKSLLQKKLNTSLIA